MTCQLYLVSPGTFDLYKFRATLSQALDAGPVASFQLRLKSQGGVSATDDDIKRACEALVPITQSYDVAFILNDRPDLVRELGADGCHIGQDDMSCTDARALLGETYSIGVTCHNSRHLAMLAGEEGADYIAFGAFFPTATKLPKTQASADLLTWWQEVATLPCVAIGGITPDNARPLIAAGADFLAVSAGVWDNPEGPAAAVRAFTKLFAA